MADSNNNNNTSIPSSGDNDINFDSKTSRQISSRNSNNSNSTNEVGEKATSKKIPPIKAPVGIAKGPDLKNCKSKIGSLQNIKHTPASSGVTIQTQKLKWNAKSKIGSLENKEHQPGGGTLKVETRKLEWKATPKVQSLQNVKHKPAGGNVKIFNESYANKSNKGSDSPTMGEVKTSSSESFEKRASSKDDDTDSLTKELGSLKV